MAATPSSHLLAASLAGAWRTDPPAFEGTAAELAAVSPLLLGSGAAALVWRKVRATPLAETAEGRALHEAWRFYAVRAAAHEREVEEVCRRLEGARVEALLVKGWAAALPYAEAGLRPSGDVDVCVRPGSTARARAALAGVRAWADLHEGFGEDELGEFDEVYARARELRLGAARVRVPAEEDHLRLLCLHMLRHGAWRPLWLCDVAAALEARGAPFDWRLFGGDDPKRARWVECAVGLAQLLLGARLADTPHARAARRLPRWLAPEVLRQWETPYATSHGTPRHRAPMRAYLRRPRGVVRDLFNRWPNPIEATVRTGGPFNELPRWPFQLVNCLSRAARFISGSGHAA